VREATSHVVRLTLLQRKRCSTTMSLAAKGQSRTDPHKKSQKEVPEDLDKANARRCGGALSLATGKKGEISSEDYEPKPGE